MRFKKKKNCAYKTTKNDYCWSYAQNKKRGLTDEQIEKGVCKHGEICEFYKKEAKHEKR